MNKNPKQRLLMLIDELKLPITQEEASTRMEKLSQDELRLLVAMYEELKNYEDAVNKAAYEADPQKYEDLEKKYQNQLTRIENEYVEKLAETQDETDKKYDEVEKSLSASSD